MAALVFGCWGSLLLPWNFLVSLLSSVCSQNVFAESFFSYVSRDKLPQNCQPNSLAELQMESALIIKASLISSNHFLVSHPFNTGISSCTPVEKFGNCFLCEQSVPSERLCYLRGGGDRVWHLCDWELTARTQRSKWGKLKESIKLFNCRGTGDVVGASSVDDSLVAKEAKGSGWRIRKKKKNVKKITKLLVRQKDIGK